MSEYPIFKHAPITEALLDIQVALPDQISPETLKHFQEDIKDRFPFMEEQGILQLEVAPDEGNGPQFKQTEEMQGYLFRSPEEPTSKVVQARMDGFTFSKLAPYESWNVFRDESHELWNRYINITHPLQVTRLGLRFINRIVLPLPFKDFHDYIRTVPEIAEGIPSALGEYFMRLVIPYVQDHAVAVLTTVTVSSEATDKTLPLIFDIDVSITENYNPTGDELWQVFERLRRIKNEIFFNSLTKDAQELFQ